MEDDALDEDTDERLREQWFGTLMDAEPEEKPPRRWSLAHGATQQAASWHRKTDRRSLEAKR